MCLLYVLLDAHFIIAGANTAHKVLAFAILRSNAVGCEARRQLQCKFNKYEAVLQHGRHGFLHSWGAYCPNSVVATCPSDSLIHTFLYCHDVIPETSVQFRLINCIHVNSLVIVMVYM